MDRLTTAAGMRISDPAVTELIAERHVYNRLLPLDGATVVELGCGRAEHTRGIAAQHPGAQITAFEVDRVQCDLNLASQKPDNLVFAYGGAEAIALPDQSVDIVMMFKSLHHVARADMARSLAEIARVLRPGGFAYISEPVFAGELNQITRIYHDEEAVRKAAFECMQAAVAEGLFELAGQHFFLVPVRYRDFAEFENKHLMVTHTQHQLSAAQYDKVKSAFEGHLGAEGARFHSPIRVDLLKKPVR